MSDHLSYEAFEQVKRAQVWACAFVSELNLKLRDYSREAAGKLAVEHADFVLSMYEQATHDRY